MDKVITISRVNNGETEQREVSPTLWANMQAGDTYGFTEVVSVPAELANLQGNVPPAVTELTVEQQIQALEEQKKAEGLSPQEKANLTKQIKALRGE